jgi:hypothetical protein
MSGFSSLAGPRGRGLDSRQQSSVLLHHPVDLPPWSRRRRWGRQAAASRAAVSAADDMAISRRPTSSCENVIVSAGSPTLTDRGLAGAGCDARTASATSRMTLVSLVSGTTSTSWTYCWRAVAVGHGDADPGRRLNQRREHDRRATGRRGPDRRAEAGGRAGHDGEDIARRRGLDGPGGVGRLDGDGGYGIVLELEVRHGNASPSYDRKLQYDLGGPGTAPLTEPAAQPAPHGGYAASARNSGITGSAQHLQFLAIMRFCVTL